MYLTEVNFGEIFSVNALRGKLHQLCSPNMQDVFIGGVSFSETKISLILKDKMAATDISLNFSINTLRGNIQQLCSPNLQDVFIGG